MSESRILVVKMSSLGDLFHALPAVRRIKSGSGAAIDWIVHEEYAVIAGCFSDVERVLVYPRRNFLARAGALARDLRSSDYDMVVDMQGLFKSGLVCAMTRSRRRVGPFDNREGAGVFYTEKVRRNGGAIHAVDGNLRMAEELGFSNGPIEFPFDFPRLDLRRFDDRLADRVLKRVAALPVSRWQSKNWPPERFAALIRRISNEIDVVFALLGAENDRQVCGEIERNCNGKAVNLAGRLSQPDAASVLKEMDLVVTNDSGPMHMAAAAGTPVCALFGPTDPARTGPYGEKHRVIRSNAHCAPCFDRVCRGRGRACMMDISVEQVAETVLDML